MKLLAKYNRINLISTVIIFLLASIAFALLLRYVLISQVDDDLRIEQNEITTYIGEYKRLPEVIKVRDQQTTYTPVEEKPSDNKHHFYTSTVYNKHEHEEELMRFINFNVQVDGQWYGVTVSKSLEGTDDLIQSIIIITVITILLILITTYLINRIVLGRLWQPFYDALKSFSNFKLGSSALHLPESNIDEFALMNKTLQQAMAKADEDYVVLREFTENASHELQTPLAVIRSKLDLLIQDEGLTVQQSNALQASYEAIGKLSRMNRSLLLLAKIENRQFSETVIVDLKTLIEEKLQQFKEIWQGRNIIAETYLNEASVTMHASLADVLLNNLLSNATKHNNDNGIIHIHLEQGLLSISNTGSLQPLNEQLLFTRFYKGEAASENHGLGLSIAKLICTVSGCTINYIYDDDHTHTFILKW
ncbi:MAG: HAMP domain-containing sensor histidine kinase [Panacibacter sp.]